MANIVVSVQIQFPQNTCSALGPRKFILRLLNLVEPRTPGHTTEGNLTMLKNDNYFLTFSHWDNLIFM